MSCKDKYCITVSGTTNEEIWKEIRSLVGGTNVGTDSEVLMNSEINDYNLWVADNWPVSFDKWLIWRIRIGTTSYGNLPRDKKHDDKVGHCYAPCPYSIQSTDLRTRHLLNLTEIEALPTKVDHEIAGTTYYMKTSSRGSKWGFECTYIGCTHYILYGKKYFYT